MGRLSNCLGLGGEFVKKQNSQYVGYGYDVFIFHISLMWGTPVAVIARFTFTNINVGTFGT